MHPVAVRPAIPADAAVISRLLGEAIRDSYSGLLKEADLQRLLSTHCPLDRLSAEIGIPGGAPGWLGWIVATDGDGEVIGATAGGVPLPGEGELYVMCTAVTHRRLHAGDALLSGITARMLDHDAARQSVSLPCEQDPALPFFRQHGFTQSGLRLTRKL